MINTEDAKNYIYQLLEQFTQAQGDSLFITQGVEPAIKVRGEMRKLGKTKLNAEQTRMLAYSLMNESNKAEFEQTHECSFALTELECGRFRVNVFVQRSHVGMVFRFIPHNIPSFETLRLPQLLTNIATVERGLVIVVGQTGAGKSTTMSSMLDHRNRHVENHIVTIEDPIEFYHDHKRSIITQREIGSDTNSYGNALKNALRQAPDVIVIGESREREAMEYALTFVETGHACFTTLHATSTTQALERIINMFPEDQRDSLLLNLSLNLKAIVGQRLVKRKDSDESIPVLEVLMNTPRIADLIAEEKLSDIKDLMEKSNDQGMFTFDQSLFYAIETGQITIPEAFKHADSVNNLRLQIKLKSKLAHDTDFLEGTEKLQII